jgi:GNAT superfamily N-acetyltransferase
MRKDHFVHQNTWWWGQTHTVVRRNGHGLVNVSVHNDIPGVATIHGLSVTEDYRKIGIGYSLLYWAEQEAKSMGATEVELCAERGSWIEDWYVRCGYKKTGECEDWNGDVLTKELK